jgi:hypothetical protein
VSDDEETVSLLDEGRRDPALVLYDEPLIVEVRVGDTGPLVMRFATKKIVSITHLELRIAGAVSKNNGFGYGRHVIRGIPWRTLEEIAAYVEGDGTDAQRMALADGIRTSRFETENTRSQLEPLKTQT